MGVCYYEDRNLEREVSGVSAWERLKNKTKELWLEVSKKPEDSIIRCDRFYCAHCAHPFTLNPALKPEEQGGERVTFIIPNPTGEVPTVYCVDICATCKCFILEDSAMERCSCCRRPGCFIIRDRERARFAGMRFTTSGSQYATLWRDAAGNLYERYEFGRNSK